MMVVCVHIHRDILHTLPFVGDAHIRFFMLNFLMAGWMKITKRRVSKSKRLI